MRKVAAKLWQHNKAVPRDTSATALKFQEVPVKQCELSKGRALPSR